MRPFLAALGYVSVLSFCISAFPCSYVQLGTADDHASAQNFDFFPGLKAGIVVSARHVEKSAGYFDGMPALATPAKWVSKYGSVSFGFGAEHPVTGVNEVGLKIYRFLLKSGKYPAPNDKPAMFETQFGQYILDTAATTDDVIRQANAVQIYTNAPFPTHFAACDKSAKCVVIEAIDGKLNIYSGPEVKVPALTNSDYPKSLELLAKCPNADCSDLTNSQWRFVKAAAQISKFSGSDLTNGVFDILGSVNETFPAQQTPTLWTMLSHENATESKFLVKNTKSSKIVMALDFKKLDYSCKSPIKVALLDSDDMSDRVSFTRYSRAFQEVLAQELGHYLHVSDADVQRIIDYPAKYTRCLDQKSSVLPLATNRPKKAKVSE